VPTPERPPLGPLSLFALGLNGIVGVGIFVAPPIVARALPGTRGAWLYLVVAVGCLPIALVYARLARALPRDGGPVLWAERAFGPGAASAIGVLSWVSSIFSASAVTRALADVLCAGAHRPAFAPWLAVAIVVALTIVNLRGLRLSALAWTVLTVLKLLPLIVIAMLGVAHAQVAGDAPATEHVTVGRAALAILFALQGFEIVPLPAGQARDADRTVPRATVAALVVAGALYALIHRGCAVALPGLSSSTDAIPEAARTLGGAALARAVGLGVIASIAGITVGTHAMTPRYLSAAIAPRSTVQAQVDPRAILISAALIAPLCAIGSLATLVSLSSAAVLGQYLATVLSLVVLAARGVETLRLRDAWAAPFAVVVVVVLLSQARVRELAIAAGVALVGSAAAAVLRRREAPGAPPS
jgi:amino acid transporter